ncbi:unnamed protein product [Heligmosomoides polygyrus]|uniref:Reverse transcriptase domain-containing protein n=1 Tax=Heligmosomoides polygyrus TaxID=6339 RepID=A0A3P7XWI1_HELPZ|nr:unnamed protein product [Heligmosomoides polygyrus]
MENAFDRVPHEVIWYALRLCGVPDELIESSTKKSDLRVGGHSLDIPRNPFGDGSRPADVCLHYLAGPPNFLRIGPCDSALIFEHRRSRVTPSIALSIPGCASLITCSSRFRIAQV